MSYPFIRSFIFGGTARGPRLAIAWHMAEGGGTVGYLSRQNPNGVSVHYVIEYDGDIVQMLNLAQMHTSIRIKNPSGSHAIRHSTDADGLYGQKAALAVMGDWADIHKSLGPNHASIGVEIEGFAANGPNAKQRESMGELWSYLRGIYPNIRSLGHRDFNLKACPGKKMPWDAIGGHGPASSENDMLVKYHARDNLEVGGTVTLKRDSQAIPLTSGDRPVVRAGVSRPAIGVYLLDDLDDRPCYIMDVGGSFHFIQAADVDFVPNDGPNILVGPVADYYEVTVGGKKVGSVALP